MRKELPYEKKRLRRKSLGNELWRVLTIGSESLRYALGGVCCVSQGKKEGGTRRGERGLPIVIQKKNPTGLGGGFCYAEIGGGLQERGKRCPTKKDQKKRRSSLISGKVRFAVD